MNYKILRNIKIVLLVMVISLMSCDKINYHRIPDHDRPVFNPGDTLIFKTKSGVIDTTVIRLTELYRASDKTNEYENLLLDYFRLKQGAKEQLAYMSIQQGVSGAYLSNNGNYLSSDQPTLNYTMSTGIIIRTDHLTRDPQRSVADDIVDMLYHVNYGVVRYKYLNSEYYYLEFQ